MSLASGRHLGLTALLAGVLLAGLLPATAMAVAPDAVPDSFTVGVDSLATSLDVLANDTDPDVDDTLTITLVEDPPNGFAAIVGGAIEYTPDAAFRGTDTFDYTVEDETFAVSSATVTVTVNGPPDAVDDPGAACGSTTDWGGAFPIPEDYVGTLPPTDEFVLFGPCGLLFNDTDPNGDTLDYEFIDPPSHGEVTYIDPDFFSYKPDPDYSTEPGDQPGGEWISDTFTYRAWDGLSFSQPATMKFWIAPINDAPTFTPGPSFVAVNDDSGAYSAAWATGVSPGPPSESWQAVHFEVDVDLNGVPGLFTVAPTIDADGVLTFIPAPGQVGLAHLTVRAVDDGGTEDWDLVGQVLPDDTSDDVSFDIVVTALIAVDDEATVAEDPDPSPVLIDVLSNDTFPAGSEITSVTQGTIGEVEIAADGLSVSYVPQPNANGSDTFTYMLDDGAGSTETATVDVTITPDNDEPVAVDDSVTVTEDDAATSVPVLANDTDVEGDALTITATTDPAKGTVVITGAGTGLTYAPDPNANGADSFTYTISDGNGGTDTVTVSVTITPLNDDPVAVDDTLTVAEDAAATAVPVLANDSDADGDTKSITAKTNGAHGVVVITGGGTGLTYRPNLNYSGSDSFTYTISDGTATDTATVSVTVTPLNDVPNAVNDAGMTVPESAGATTLTVMTNDSDADGDTLTITGKTNGAHGTVAITGGGTGLTYDPVQLYFGSDVFTYTISDGHGGSDTATVLLTVVKDTTKPVVTAPSERFYNQTVGSSTTKAHLTWSGTDTGGTGIASYKLQVSINGGTFSTIALASPTSTSINRTLTDKNSYRYRVRATDKQGNVGAYVYGPTFTPARIQNTHSNVTYTGAWSTTSNASALGGSHRSTTSTSARASITRTVWDVAWVATKTPTSGSAEVWIDGALAATVNLRSSSNTYRQLVFQRHFATLASHTVEIRPIGGGRVYLDAFLIYR